MFSRDSTYSLTVLNPMSVSSVIIWYKIGTGHKIGRNLGVLAPVPSLRCLCSWEDDNFMRKKMNEMRHFRYPAFRSRATATLELQRAV